MTKTGMVYLVGAGPGDAGLLTVRGAALLEQADVVIYDGLVNPDLLRHVPAGAEIIYGGKHDRTRAMSQANLNALLLARAREGRRLVRLKGGDPFVLARGGEEALLLAEAGIPFEVVPGVSSAEAAAAYAGIPLTHRGQASSYTVVTGHEAPDSPDNKVDWTATARMPGTLVVLMGLRNLEAITTTLMRYGRPAETPAAVVSWSTTPRQRTVVGTLANIAGEVRGANLAPPAVTIIGEVVRLREKLGWFERRPLLGQRIVLTQRRDLAQSLTGRLADAGALVLQVPATRFLPPADPAALAQTLEHLDQFDWLVFSHPRSVEGFFQEWFRRHADLRELVRARLGAFGPRTAQALRDYHLAPAAVSGEHRPEKIVEMLGGTAGLAGQRVLLLRAQEGRKEFAAALKAVGAQAEEAACYATAPETEDPDGSAARLTREGADWLVFHTGLALEHFNARFDLAGLCRQFPALKVLLVQPALRRTLESLGLREAVVAEGGDEHNILAALRHGL